MLVDKLQSAADFRTLKDLPEGYLEEIARESPESVLKLIGKILAVLLVRLNVPKEEVEETRRISREEGREEGRKLGREEGREEEKSSLIRKKLEKGKTISEIADDLEDTEENIVHLIEEFHLGRKES